MKWDVMELERRCVNNTLFKSKDCNQAKKMLATLKEVENNHFKIGAPESIENEEQLKLVKLVHQKIMSRDQTKKRLKGNSKPPGPVSVTVPKR